MDTGQLRTLRDGQRYIRATTGVEVNLTSVYNYIKQEGLKAYAQQKKPHLTEKQMEARYHFALEHVNWTVDQWKHVMFSDETLISRVGPFGKKFYYCRPEHKHLRVQPVQETQHHGGGKMMLWGCITYYGVGDACWIPGILNAQGYVDVLNSYVLASRNWYRMDRARFIFQQDNARVHTADVVKDFFARTRITVMNWPANSPDLNPIEHVWAYIKYHLDQLPEHPKTMKELWDRVQDIWTSIPLEFIQNLYESLPTRMKMVCKNRGGHTKY